MQAAEFNLAATGDKVTVSLHNPEAASNRGLVGVSLKLAFNKDWVLAKSDIVHEVGSPWAFAHEEITPGQVFIQAIYVQAGKTGDSSVGPKKFVTLNFHPRGAKPGQIRLDTAGSLLIAKNNAKVLNQKAPISLDFAVSPKPPSFFSNLWLQLLRFFEQR